MTCNNILSRSCFVLVGLVATAMLPGRPAQAQPLEVRRLVVRADEAFELGQGAWDVKLDRGGAVTLYDHVLVEDDAPGVGGDAEWMQADNKSPATELGGGTQIKKVLHVERPAAREVRLCLPAAVSIRINGRPLDTSGLLSDGGPYPYPPVPPGLLKPGDNEIVLCCPAGAPRAIKYAPPEDILRNAPDRRGRPPRSFQSLDGGQTWQAIRGEYLVRLHLVQFVPQGHFISPVLDLGQAGEQPNVAGTRRVPSAVPQVSGTRRVPSAVPYSASVDGTRRVPDTLARPVGGYAEQYDPLGLPLVVRSVALRADAELPAGTAVELAVRTGTSPVYEPQRWSDWRPAGAALAAGHRYLQWQATLRSSDPLATPRLRGVAVEAQLLRPAAPPWAAGLRVVACHNEQIRYTSMPFEYEDPRHPRMVALRRKYNLDAVVAPATSETERLVRLRDWVAHQWQYQPPAKDYPAWDADEILRRKIGFCVQYAIVMMQAAVSLGHQARFVFGHNPGGTYEGGHECCEVWSNEHAKWVFYDVHQNWHYVDPRSQVPMNLLEVHDLVMKTYYAGRPVTLANRPHERLPTDGIAICYGRSMAPGMPAENCASHYAGGRYTAPTRWLFVNCVPRNNFYAHAYPQPKQQGCEWWAWSGYWCWQDAQTPTQWLFGRFTGRRSDLDWTLNQVHFAATVTDRPGELAVQMGTVTPYFQTFRVCMDGQGWQDSPRAFTWPLHTGRNRLEMRVRNTAGVEGPPSFLEVDRPQM